MTFVYAGTRCLSCWRADTPTLSDKHTFSLSTRCLASISGLPFESYNKDLSEQYVTSFAWPIHLKRQFVVAQQNETLIHAVKYFESSSSCTDSSKRVWKDHREQQSPTYVRYEEMHGAPFAHLPCSCTPSTMRGVQRQTSHLMQHPPKIVNIIAYVVARVVRTPPHPITQDCLELASGLANSGATSGMQIWRMTAWKRAERLHGTACLSTASRRLPVVLHP